MSLRERRKEAFKKQHGVGIGIASFFVKAGIAALRLFPQLNAEIQGEEIVFKNYYDIGMAVGVERRTRRPGDSRRRQDDVCGGRAGDS